MIKRWLMALFVVSSFFWLACASEEMIKAEIEKARACDKDEDCVSVAHLKCPFGCALYVHKDKKEHIEGLIKGYPSTCAYDCLQMEFAGCKDNLCTTQQKP